MIGFEYYNPAKIVFGEDSEKQLKGLLEAYEVKSLLLVYSGDFIKDLGIYQVISDAAKALGIKFSENGEVVPNPSIDLVRKLVEQGKKDGVDFVLAVGGGSAIDTAKAVFTVDNYKEYLSLQCDTAVRNIVKIYPYDMAPNVDTTGY